MFTVRDPLRPRTGSLPTARDRRGPARLAIAAGVAVAGIGTAGLVDGVEPFRTYFYAFVWWGWIALASGWTALRNAPSLLIDRPRAFALVAWWSIPFWLFFEVLNVVLQNWYYVGAMPTRPERLFGMAVCFATVLPGVIATAEWLSMLGLFRTARCRPWRVGPRFVRACLGLGVLFTVLPMVKPLWFYPLVWGATVLLGEAWLAHRGRRGLLSTLAAGNPRPALLLLAAGFATGGLWESWNFHAGAKWIYTVPGFEELKLFEMPVLGFFGFPPFALECWSFCCLLVGTGLCPPIDGEWEPRPARPRRELLGALVAGVVSLPMMWATDVWVVRETRPQVEDVPSIDALLASDLRGLGVHDARDVLPLLEADGPNPLDDLGPTVRHAIRDELELMRTAGLGRRGLTWLHAVGVRHPRELAELDWQAVIELSTSDAGASLRREHGPRPYGREVRYWIRAAAHRVERGDFAATD
ncbi:MAG: hypothetical protein AAFZ65_08600 [Planctomycetota bacterium]